MVTALQAIASREVDPLLEVVVSVTQIARRHGVQHHSRRRAWMNGTVRVFDPGVWQELPGRFERIVQRRGAGLRLHGRRRLISATTARP